MSFTRFLAVAQQRDHPDPARLRSLIIVLIMPVILVLLFGYGVNLDLKHLPIYVYDREGSQQSQDLLKRFQASEYFDVVRVVNNYPALVTRHRRRPRQDGHRHPVGFLADACATAARCRFRRWSTRTDDNTANVLIGYAQAVVQGYSSDVQLDWLRSRGQHRAASCRSASKPAPGTTRTWRAAPSSFPACWRW